MNGMMKKLLSALFAAAVLTACFHAPVTTADADATADTLTIEVDSMAVSAMLTFDNLPADTLLQRCLAQFVGQTMFFDDDAGEAVDVPAFAGDLPAYLDACAHKKWDELFAATFPAEDYEEDADVPTPEELVAMAVEDSASLTAYQMDYRQVYATDSVVSWACHYDFFVHNTAHPSFGSFGQSYRRHDGQPLGHELLTGTDSPAFRQLLKEALRRWLAEVMDVQCDTDAALKEYLFAEQADPNALPLPAHAPYLTRQGVALPYAENELTFSREPALLLIPYEQAAPYLTFGR